jgi:hypothetical protein
MVTVKNSMKRQAARFPDDQRRQFGTAGLAYGNAPRLYQSRQFFGALEEATHFPPCFLR